MVVGGHGEDAVMMMTLSPQVTLRINLRTPSLELAQLLSTAVALQLYPRPHFAGLHSRPAHDYLVVHLWPPYYRPKVFLVHRALLRTS